MIFSKKSIPTLLIFVFIGFLSSCGEEEPAPSVKIIGEWNTVEYKAISTQTVDFGGDVETYISTSEGFDMDLIYHFKGSPNSFEVSGVMSLTQTVDFGDGDPVVTTVTGTGLYGVGSWKIEGDYLYMSSQDGTSMRYDIQKLTDNNLELYSEQEINQTMDGYTQKVNSISILKLSR